MADKAITELVSAEDIGATDLFVLQQNNTAKKLPGQVLLNWLTRAADGHGGIHSIEKLSTDVLADTYRITLADTTAFDFVVNNGRGISSITKVGTSDLVDTYRISYNDNTTGTFAVTNGAKGDKGDNAYIWVKYASQEPTASSHSFGDLPDAWIGVYFGTASTAPTDWQQYSWYQWKGEKGDTGEPAVLVSSSVEYQVSDSGTIIPSGAWSFSVPVVPQGRYLWTRTTKTFNTGFPVVSYSVSRMGLDGSGSVSSVAGVSPDSNGNVPLNAASVKALALSGGTMEGTINMNGQKLSGLNEPTSNDEAATKGFTETYVSNIVKNKLSMELLWENASPASNFSEQNVSLDLSPYDIVLIATKYNTGANYEDMTLVKIGSQAIIRQFASASAASSTYASRNVTAGKQYVKFTSASAKSIASSAAGTENDGAVIPVRIYGIKGVSA